MWLHWDSAEVHGISDLHCGMGDLSCNMWALVPDQDRTQHSALEQES